MIKAVPVILLMMSASLLFLIDEAAASTPNWKAFNDDYTDTDSDGEQDDYSSYDLNDRVDLFDTLVDFVAYPTGGFTVLTLKSDPENKAAFGNILDPSVVKGKGILIDVRIVRTTEEDGDAKESYEIMSVMVLTNEGNSDRETESSGSDTLSSILAVALCCGPQIAIPVIIAIIVMKQQKKKKMAAEAKIWSDGSHEAPPQAPSTTPEMQPQPVQAPRSRTGNLWNENDISHGQPRILEPPPDRTADQAHQAANDDMKGLEDFMKGLQAEGSDAGSVIKDDASEKNIPQSGANPPAVP